MQAQPSDSQTIRIWCPLSIFNRLVLQIMYYSNFFRHGSRAGLVALIFVLIISLVSAVPIPAAEFGLSTTLSPSSLNGQPEAYNAKILLNASSQISTLPTTRALIRRVRCWISSYTVVLSASEPGSPSYIRAFRQTWTINLYVAIMTTKKSSLSMYVWISFPWR